MWRKYIPFFSWDITQTDPQLNTRVVNQREKKTRVFINIYVAEAGNSGPILFRDSGEPQHTAAGVEDKIIQEAAEL